MHHRRLLRGEKAVVRVPVIRPPVVVEVPVAAPLAQREHATPTVVILQDTIRTTTLRNFIYSQG
jgi:hypothetical protein